MTTRPLILITNDDGIDSPGLHATANAVADLGDLLIVAPATQQTGAGRSYPIIKDKAIYKTTVPIQQQSHVAYKAFVSPAQAVSLAIFDLTERSISLCISGINYGENIGSGLTISGTVGAAMEASSHGIPAIAMSLEVPPVYHLSHSTDIDFSTAAHFTRFFAKKVLQHGLPPDTNLLKIDIPAQATPQTPWREAIVSRHRYYTPTPSNRTHLTEQKAVGYKISFDPNIVEQDSDIYILAVDKQVAVVPLTLDMTSYKGVEQLAQHYSA